MEWLDWSLGFTLHRLKMTTEQDGKKGWVKEGGGRNGEG